MEADEGLRKLGGLTVFPIGFGTARVSIEGRPDWETGLRVVMAAVEAGITLFDTADSYCLSSASEHGYGERLVAAALVRLGAAATRDVVVATKVGEVRHRGSWNLVGSPHHIKEACHASLRALSVDAIDLYQLHRPDPKIPLEESIGTLVELRDEGHVRELGICNVTAPELERALAVAPLVAVQNPLRFDDPRQDAIIEICERRGLTFLAHSPFGGPAISSRLARNPWLLDTGEFLGATTHQVALAALLGRSKVVVPIPGSAKPGRPLVLAAAANLRLAPELLPPPDQTSP